MIYSGVALLIVFGEQFELLEVKARKIDLLQMKLFKLKMRDYGVKKYFGCHTNLTVLLNTNSQICENL